MDSLKEKIYKDIFYAQSKIILQQRRDGWIPILIFAGFVTLMCGVKSISLFATGSVVFGVIEAVLGILNLFNCLFAVQQIVKTNRKIKREDTLYQMELAAEEEVDVQ